MSMHVIVIDISIGVTMGWHWWHNVFQHSPYPTHPYRIVCHVRYICSNEVQSNEAQKRAYRL